MRHERRILIVDDDDAIRALLFTVLRRRGMPADTARNGLEALEKLGGKTYALVLLDLMMPHMDGYALLEQLAALPPATRPLVIVLTAGLEPRPFDTTVVIGLLHKPFDVELLVDMIAGCISTVEPAPQPTVPSVSPQTEETN